MPFVRIDLFEGRTEEQKIALAREVTEVVSRIQTHPKKPFMSSSMICLRELTTHKAR